jgi:hypothetical protein
MVIIDTHDALYRQNKIPSLDNNMSVKENLRGKILAKIKRSSQLSPNTNIARRAINVTQDVVKIIAQAAVSLLKDIMTELKFPLSLFMSLLQAIAVGSDRNYPKKLKILMIAGIFCVAAASVAIWILAPLVPLFLLGLSIASHLVSLFQRATKLKINYQDYANLQQEPPRILLEPLLQRYQTLRQLPDGDPHQNVPIMEEHEQQLLQMMETYCTQTTLTDAVTQHQKNRLYDAIISVALIIVRGIAAGLFLALAASVPQISIPLLVIILCCNLFDFIRNVYMKHRTQSLAAGMKQAQLELIDFLDNHNPDPEPDLINDNDYDRIMDLLDSDETPLLNDPTANIEPESASHAPLWLYHHALAPTNLRPNETLTDDCEETHSMQ